MVYKNLLYKGIDNDTDIRMKPNDAMHDASGIDLFSNGEFLTAKGIRGTANIKRLFKQNGIKNVRSFGSFVMNVRINGSLKRSIILFYGVNGDFLGSDYLNKIWVHALDGSFSQEVIGSSSSAGFYNNARISGVIVGEGGYESLYFTDGITKPKKLDGRIDEVYDTNSEYRDLTIIKEMIPAQTLGSAIIPAGTNNSTGFTKVGSYQACFRLINTKTRRKTKFSPLSSLVKVYDENNNGVNSYTNKYVLFRSIVNDSYRKIYDKIQWAVVRNTDGADNPPVTFYLSGETNLPRIPASGIGSRDVLYRYNSTSEEESLDGVTRPIDELVQDEAAIKSVKTISVKDNTLILGGVTYETLERDNGALEFDTATEIITNDSENYVGYFRNELYRYAISYHDEFGNWSIPEPFDFSSVSGTKDWKFSDRQSNNIIEVNSSGVVVERNLGLHITNIRNHPTWAKGFRILRAKRREDIIYQSPLIHAELIEAAPAYVTYPPSGEDTANQNGTIVPAFYYRRSEKIDNQGGTLDCYDRRNVHSVDIIRNRQATTEHGQTSYYPATTRSGGFIYPPDYLYNNGVSPKTILEDMGGFNLQYVDWSLFKGKFQNDYQTGEFGYTPTYAKAGSYYDTRVGCKLFATNLSDYFSSSNLEASLSFVDRKLSNNIDNLFKITRSYNITSGISSGIAININSNIENKEGRAAVSVCDFDSLKDTISVGYFPRACRGIFLQTKDPILNLDRSSRDILSNMVMDNLVASRYPVYIDDNNYKYAVLPIVNITKGLSDDRYGEKYEELEYIPTNVYQNLNSINVPGYSVDVDIWGGDCYISKHVFRTQETGFVCTDSANFSLEPAAGRDVWLTEFWGETTGGTAIKKPEPLAGASQDFVCWLESETSGDFANFDFSTEYRDDNTVTENISKIRYIPEYLYNLSITREDDVKVWIGFDPSTFNRFSFPSRILYSAPKIYNSQFDEFDTFPVGNTKDLDETYGDIAGFGIAYDNLYAVQERGACYLPIQKNVIETADGNELSIRSNDFVGIPKYLTTKYGAKSFDKVCSTGSSVVFLDDNSRRFFEISQGLNDTTVGFVKKFREAEDFNFIIKYNQYENIIYLINKYRIIEYNKNINAFTSDTEVFKDNSIGATQFELNNIDQKVLLDIATDDGYPILIQHYIKSLGLPAFGDQELWMRRWKSNDTDFRVFEEDIKRFVTVSVSGNDSENKVFDVLHVGSTDPLSRANFTAYKDNGETLKSTVDLNSLDSREGLYKFRVPRDSTRSRIRGVACLVQILLDNTKQSAISSINMIYRVLQPQGR